MPYKHDVAIGFDPETDFYCLPIDFFELEVLEDFIKEKNVQENTDVIAAAFKFFKDGCYKKYSSFTDKEDLFHYFNNILFTYMSLKRYLFLENKDKVIHKLLKIEISDTGNKMQQIASMHYYYLNLMISCLESYIKPYVLNNNENIIENPPFKPKNLGFRIKHRDYLNSAYDRLRFLYFIHQDVRFKDFEDTFIGWTPINKITWLKGPGLLSYFIKSINGKGIEDEKKSIWITTINCFQDRNLKDYTVKQLRFAKKPTKTEEIDLVIKAINRNSGA